jgi:hypothetical protein
VANHCQICGAECSECLQRRVVKARQSCECGCGETLSGKRWHARFATQKCRYRVRNRNRRNSQVAE